VEHGWTTLTNFQGCSPYFKRVIELRSNVIASISSNESLMLWDTTTGVCIHTKEKVSNTDGLLKLRGGFVCVSNENAMKVLNKRRYRGGQLQHLNNVQAMLRLRETG